MTDGLKSATGSNVFHGIRFKVKLLRKQLVVRRAVSLCKTGESSIASGQIMVIGHIEVFFRELSP